MNYPKYLISKNRYDKIKIGEDENEKLYKYVSKNDFDNKDNDIISFIVSERKHPNKEGEPFPQAIFNLSVNHSSYAKPNDCRFKIKDTNLNKIWDIEKNNTELDYNTVNKSSKYIKSRGVISFDVDILAELNKFNITKGNKEIFEITFQFNHKPICCNFSHFEASIKEQKKIGKSENKPDYKWQDELSNHIINLISKETNKILNIELKPNESLG